MPCDPGWLTRALVPSRVFEEASLWTARGDDWRAVEFAGYAAGAAYRIGVRAHAPTPAAPGGYRGRVRLERVRGGRFEWAVDEELAVGRVRPSDLAATLEALFRGAEASGEACGPRDDRRGPPAGLAPARGSSSAWTRWRCAAMPTARPRSVSRSD